MAPQPSGGGLVFRYLTSVDPGADMGFAYWKDSTLTGCGLGGFVLVGELVCEMPQAYRNSPVDPNALLSLARKVGRLEEAAERLKVPCRLLLPREWKGSVKKDEMCSRILAHLSPEELDIYEESVKSVPKSKRHNVTDACGLGLFHLGRMQRGGV